MSEIPAATSADATDLLNCDGVAFGSSVLLEMDGPDSLTPAAREAIHSLRSNVSALLQSSSEPHKRAVERINSNFRVNDQLEFNTSFSGRDKLGEHHVLDWLAGSNDATFLKLARWNVERRRALEQQLGEDHDELVEGALEKTINLINLDFFPADALRRVRLAAKTYAPFRAMDSFESGAMGASGYFDAAGITLANLYGLATEQFGVSPNLEQTAFHELLHGSGEVSGGGFFLDPAALIYSRALEEFFVTHSVSVAHSGKSGPQIEEYDPSDRVGERSFAYSGERRIAGLLSSPDIAGISPELWAASFFSDGSSKYRKELSSKLKMAFTAIRQHPDAFNEFNNAYEQTWVADSETTRNKLLNNLEIDIAASRGEKLEILYEGTHSENNDAWYIKIPA